MNPQPTPKWYETTWFTIAMLVLVAPVGVFLLWRYMSWPHKLKWQVTAGALVWFFVASRLNSSNDTQPNRVATNPPSAIATPRLTAVSAPRFAKSQVKVNLSPSPAKDTAKETVEGLMKKQFKNRLRNVKVFPNKNGSCLVQVQFNKKERFTDKATQNYMEGDMRDAYKNLYNSGVKITSADVGAYEIKKDKYGNDVGSLAYRTVLKSKVASKINWINYRDAKWDDLWDVTFAPKAKVVENRIAERQVEETRPSDNRSEANQTINLSFDTPIWNIPPLLNKSRDEISDVLGFAEDPHFDSKPGKFSDNYSMWSKDETKLFIRFTPNNDGVVEIQLNFWPEQGRDYPDERAAVLKAGNLKLRGAGYNLEFTESETPSGTNTFSSVTITPK